MKVSGILTLKKEDLLKVTFEDENKKEFIVETNLLIGADGANSRVRKSLNINKTVIGIRLLQSGHI